MWSVHYGVVMLLLWFGGCFDLLIGVLSLEFACLSLLLTLLFVFYGLFCWLDLLCGLVVLQ